jgi:hypothetical protein
MKNRRSILAEGKGEWLDEHTLHLVIPLTPSRNDMDKWNRYAPGKLRQNTAIARTAVAASLSMAFRTCAWPRPWTDQILFSAVRCSNQRRRLDPDGTIGGLKAALDAVVTAGIVLNDTAVHVKWGPTEDRIRSMWRTIPGQATHLLIARLEVDGRRRDELEALDPILNYISKGDQQ